MLKKDTHIGDVVSVENVNPTCRGVDVKAVATRWYTGCQGVCHLPKKVVNLT